MLKLTEVTKTYATESVTTRALDNVSLEIGDGEFVAIVGPSGCGKSTLLNVIGALDSVDNGTVLYRDRDLARLNDHELQVFRRDHVGFVFQSFNLVEDLTAVENAELPLVYQGVKNRRERATAALARMSIAHRADHQPAQLSGGQQQRVAIARAIAGEPHILLADEPTGNLDSASGLEVLRLLMELNEQGVTLVLVTHAEEVAALAHRTISMRDGRIIDDVRQAVG